MTKIKIENLVWDKWNVEHIQKHSVTEFEIEVVTSNFDYHKQAHFGRYLLVGKVNNRILSIIVDRKKAKTYYVVTARDASRKERKKLNEK